MCGILAILRNVIPEDELVALISLIRRRGPDFQSTILKHRTSCGLELSLYASVLHLRGQNIQTQPIIDDHGNVLLFNGQIYQFERNNLPEEESDTSFLMSKLVLCVTKSDVVNQLTMIDGPFAFIYWSDKLKTLFYGRDIFGRKSLCKLEDSASNIILISSVADPYLELEDMRWSEISCDGIIALEYDGLSRESLTKYQWNIDIIYPPSTKCQQLNYHSSSSAVRVDSNYIKRLNPAEDNPETFSEGVKLRSLDLFESELIQAVRTRVIHNREHCLECRKLKDTRVDCHHSKFAVAFSGGIDSTILAMALDKVLDPNETIDLISCAFRPSSPDRESTAKAFRELISLRPSRLWRLIICDIDRTELVTSRTDIIRRLIWPCKTVIDDSLGCACWFIGRGRGRALDGSIINSTPELISAFSEWNTGHPYPKELAECDSFICDYTCPASIIFAGSGIDEQLGGYSSHKSSWTRFGIKGLLDEISFQMRRLPTRNLGRDDRVYSDHGRDLKIPYLDFDFVSLLNDLPAGVKIDMNLSPDLGPKLILRLLANRWGLVETSKRVKKAMQFGTKIAKLENTTESAGDICTRLTQIVTI